MGGFDPVLGLMPGGGGRRIPELPVNPTNDQLKAALQEIIARLNNFDRDTVLIGTIAMTLDGSGIQTVSVDHNLGYKPRVSGELAGREFQISETASETVDGTTVAMPTYLDIVRLSYVELVADTTKVYLRALNGASLTDSISVKYFLSRTPAV